MGSPPAACGGWWWLGSWSGMRRPLFPPLLGLPVAPEFSEPGPGQRLQRGTLFSSEELLTCPNPWAPPLMVQSLHSPTCPPPTYSSTPNLWLHGLLSTPPGGMWLLALVTCRPPMTHLEVPCILSPPPLDAVPVPCTGPHSHPGGAADGVRRDPACTWGCHPAGATALASPLSWSGLGSPTCMNICPYTRSAGGVWRD